MKTTPNPTSVCDPLHTGRVFSLQSRSRIVALWLATLLVVGYAALPPAALAFYVRGIGQAALGGHDLTDPEDDGDPETNTNYNATFSSSEEPGFGGSEAAFNVFDNRVGNTGNDKWCCGDQNNFPTNPISIDATFAAPIVLRHFTLTSGEDAPERDPLAWQIQGSNDGVNFTTIYARNNLTTSVWTARKQVVEFIAGARGDYAVPAAYTTIRFITTATNSLYQLSEIEYFDTPPESLVVTTTADENDGNSDPSAGTGTSLREALNYAATLSGAGTITFSNSTAGGAVNFHDGTARTITLTTGGFGIGKSVTITGPGANLLTVKRSEVVGTPDFRIFTIDNGMFASAGPTVTISGLTIANGRAIGNMAPAPHGGAIYSVHGTVTIHDCSFAQNHAQANGGAIFSNGFGGSADMTISNSTFSGNSAGSLGGAIFNSGLGTGSANLTISNSTFDQNTAFRGGHIYNYTDNGNGIGTATIDIANCTFRQVSGNAGGGIYNDGDSAGSSIATIRLGNTILATAAAPANIINDDGTVTSLGYNLASDAAGGDATTGPGGFLNATGDIRNTDPKLDTNGLQNNGGPTMTFKLLPGSPALDAGSNSLAVDANSQPLTTDQRGSEFDRVIKGKSASPNPIVDIGAFEVQIITFAPGIATNGVQIDASDAPLDLTGMTIGATPAGGTFSGPGVDANGFFHPEQLAPGTYTITYTTTTPDEYGNTGSKTFNITVTATGPYLRIIATAGPGGTGIDVPGEPAGTKFTKLGLASMDEGAIGARVRIKPAGGAEVPAIFVGDAMTAGIVARGGDLAPGTAGNFASFGEPVFGGEAFAFTATLTGVPKAIDTGLWSTLGGALALVAGEGQAAPDRDGNALNNTFFDKIQSYALSADGEALSFVATLKGTGVKGTNKTGVWQQRLRFGGPGTSTRLIFRTGDLYQVTTDFRDPNNLFDDILEDRPVKSLKLFVPAKTIPGQRRSYASSNGELFAFAKFAAGREALLGWVDNGFFFDFSFFAIENTTVGHLGVPSINSDGNFAMRAGLSIGAVLANNPNVKITGKNDQTILTGRSQSNIGILSQEGSPVSSTNPQIFTAFEEPAFNDNYNTAFFAKVKAPGLPASQQRVLIYDAGPLFNFEPGVLARTGTPAADLTGGVLWKDFTAMALPDSNYGPVFLATLTGPGVTAKNGIGLWATDLDGTIRLLLRTGDTIPVNGVDKTVSLIATLGAALDSPGQGRYVDLLGNVSATLTFTDGTTALVHFGMPTPAAP